MLDKNLIRRYKTKMVQLSDVVCWPWHGAKLGPDGRGVIWYKGKNVSAPRIAWLLAYGLMPPRNKFVCHSCDNGNCVNPAHLWLGTQADNIANCVRKHRHGMHRHPESSFFNRPESNQYRPKGSRHGNSRLTEKLVRTIRSKYRRNANGRSNTAALATKYKISRWTIARIIARRCWVHI